MRLALAAVSLLLLSTSTAALAESAAPPSTQPHPVACTMEAKICPDGSSVSRSGPNCEFARCPDGTTPTIQTPAPPSPPANVPADGSGTSGAAPGSDAGSNAGGMDSDGGTPDDTPPPGDADE